MPGGRTCACDAAPPGDRDLAPGSGLVVPADDRDRFLREVPHPTVVEIDANHLTIGFDARAAAAIAEFFADRAHDS